MKKKIDLFDCDGCLYPVAGMNPSPASPPEELVAWMAANRRRQAIVTGQPVHVALQVPGVLRAPIEYIAPDYGSLIFDRNGCLVASLIPTDELEALANARAVASEMFTALGGIEDSERGAQCVANFFFLPGDFLTAQRVVEASEEFANLTRTGRALVRVQWNAGDNSMNLMPASTSKGNAVKWLQEQGFEINIAAGDTTSDIPLLLAARRPIATHNGDGVIPALAEIATRSSRGFVAALHRPHGLGLVDGLNALVAA